LVSADGIKPDEKQVEAIVAFKDPTTKKELMRFLDMVK